MYTGVPSATKEKLDAIVGAIENVSKNNDIELKIVGITAEQFASIYSRPIPTTDCVKFLGRVEHQKVLEIVANSDWAIILREPSRVVQAGFPTKLVESISCGTPVIINKFSNVSDYCDETNSLIISDFESLEKYIIQACNIKTSFSNDIFDYHYYLDQLEILLGNNNSN